MAPSEVRLVTFTWGGGRVEFGIALVVLVEVLMELVVFAATVVFAAYSTVIYYN